MPDLLTFLISSSLFLLIGYGIGFPLVNSLEGNKQLSFLIAPPLGLILFGILGIPFFTLLPLNRITIIIYTTVLCLLTRFLYNRRHDPLFNTPSGLPIIWYFAAIFLALIPIFTLIPHQIGQGYLLGPPVYDHVKVSIVDEIINNGIPPHDPFFYATNSTNILSYYYLFYFIAAVIAKLVGTTGWTAELSLSFVTTFMSITCLSWVVLAYSQKKISALYILIFCCIGDLKLYLTCFFEPLAKLLSDQFSFQTWIYQCIWVPQHIFSGICVIFFFIYLIKIISNNKIDFISSSIAGLIAAAGYCSSVWVSGFGIPIVTIIFIILTAKQLFEEKLLSNFLQNFGCIVFFGLLGSSFFLLQQIARVKSQSIVALWVYPVFNADIANFRPFIDILAYWGILLVLNYGCIYLCSLIFLFQKKSFPTPQSKLITKALYALFLAPLLVAQFSHSIIANNDLGWRITLNSVFAMMVIASFALSTMHSKLNKIILNICLMATLSPGIISAFYFVSISSIDLNYSQKQLFDAKYFYESLEMWNDVRKVTPKTDYVLNNPKDLSSLIPWETNIGWGLLSQRRSCFSHHDPVKVYTTMSNEKTLNYTNIINKIFSGSITEHDLYMLKTHLHCDTLVIVNRDKLWNNKILANNNFYHLIHEKKGKWKIYR